MEHLPLLAALFFVAAIVYSMAGLGGGSTYLALLTLFAFSYPLVPKIALFCNLAVAASGFWFFTKAGHFSLKRTLPFVVSSIPMAYWGGSLPIGKTLFTLLLGLSLAVASLRMFFPDQLSQLSKTSQARPSLSWKKAWVIGLPVGALLGFLSGVVGIGGGIYLIPVLLLLSWADAKEAAASASFFILVNSLAGLGGQFFKSGFPSGDEMSTLWILPLATFLGGQIGSRLGSRKISPWMLQRVSASLILYASGRLLIGLW